MEGNVRRVQLIASVSLPGSSSRRRISLRDGSREVYLYLSADMAGLFEASDREKGIGSAFNHSLLSYIASLY